MTRIKPKYTDEELITLLKKEAERLGRTPSMQEIDSTSDMPSSKTYCSRFGRWLIALRKAGLEPAGINILSAEEIREKKTLIINTLLDLNKKNKKIPTVNDFNWVMPKSSLERYFGTFNNALSEAGLVPRYSKKEYLYLSDDELLQAIKDFHNKTGQIPKISDFNMKKGYPAPATYKKRFGGWSNAIRLAGFEPRPFPFRPILCEFYDGCNIQNQQLNLIQKFALYIANKLLIFAKLKWKEK